MDGAPKPNRLIRFSVFQVDLDSGELFKSGRKVKLQGQPFELLVALLERPGEVVTREELQQKVWPSDTVVDFDRGLNKAVNKVREALGDSAETPRFVETLPRRGYRFIGSIQETNGATPPPPEAALTPSAPQAPPTPILASHSARKRWVWSSLAAAVAALVLAALSFGTYQYLHRGENFNLQNMQVTRLTDNGKAARLAISPDGRYVAWVIRDGEKESLWVRQVATGSDVRVLAPGVVDIIGVRFSPDGNYLYFTRANKNNWNYASVYRIPSLGGATTQVVHDVDTGVSFSPDGKQMTFLRGYVPDGVWKLMIADADGGNLRRVASLPAIVAGNRVSAPVWSRDGKRIAFNMLEDAKGQRSVIKIVSPMDGMARDLLVRPSGVHLGQPVWLPDGRGLLFPMRGAAPGSRGQLWYVSFPQGHVRRFTNDPTDYDTCCMGLTADGKTLAVMQDNTTANLWLAPSGKLDQARQITSGEPYPWAFWTANGQIFTQDPNGQFMTLAVDGTHVSRLIFRHPPSDVPSQCGDGRYYVYASASEGATNIWRADADGGNPVRLTNTGSAIDPVCSPDGKWVVYALHVKKGVEAMRISILGGDPLQLPGYLDDIGTPISPDSSMVAFGVWNEVSGGPNLLKVFALDNGKPLYSFKAPLAEPLIFKWSPDGRAIDYVMTKNGIGNIWQQPLSGDPPKQITHFGSEEISTFDWSHDGKQLLVSRGDTTRNVFLLSNFR